jgi:hypothetical protein
MTIRGLFSSASEVIGFILQLELSHIPGIVKLWESTGRAGGLPWINYTKYIVIPRPPITTFEGMLDRGIQKQRDWIRSLSRT